MTNPPLWKASIALTQSEAADVSAALELDGTGHHETTALCLEVLSDLARERAFRNVLDLGTGTGLLAIGAAKLWKRRVLASDIDPVAVEVARANARANNVGPLVAAVVADGL